MISLPPGLLALLERPSPCLIATTMPDGSPHLTQTWVGTDGKHILINTVRGFQKLKNIDRDPRVAVTILDPEDTFSYWSVRGTVLGTTIDGAAAHIEELSQKYTGGPYTWARGRVQERVLLTIGVDKIVHQPWG